MDIRAEELATLHAIYGDTVAVDAVRHTARADVPLYAEHGVPVVLAHGHSRTATIHHAPPIQLSFVLPEKYPYEAPPHVEVRCEALPAAACRRLAARLAPMWPAVRDQVVFAMVDDTLQYAGEHGAALVGREIDCRGSAALYERVVAHDRAAKQAEFARRTFACAICQQSRKGASCSRFDACGHVFCNACLRAFFVSLVERGAVEKVHCPDAACSAAIAQRRDAVLRLDHLHGAEFDFGAFRAAVMTPPVPLALVRAVLGADAAGGKLYARYTDAYASHQHVLIAKLFPARLVACPRTGCPAMIFRDTLDSPLVICRTCDYAFCNVCRKSYHSAAIDCSRSNKDKQYYGIAADDLQAWLDDDRSSARRTQLRYKYGADLMNKVSNEYLMDTLFTRLLREEAHDFSKCPTCDLVVQRSEGCNKMKCSSCHTSFCHLCDGFLDPDKPYDHYRDPANPCHGKLFEGMPGVED